MSNMPSVIKQNNYKVLSIKNVDWLCNCINKDSCPLNNKCLQTFIIYKADVITNKGSHIYYGASNGGFKTPYNNHTNLFHHRHHEQDRELSKLIWQLTLHKKWSFPLRISSVNKTKSAVSCGFGHIYWKNS